MSPYLYDPLVRDHLAHAMDRAEIDRLRRAAPSPATWGRRTIRDAVGFRLIAIGVRLVDNPVAAVEELDQAA